MFDHAQHNLAASLQEPQLLEFFELLEWAAGEFGELEEELATVSVDADVLQKGGRIAAEERFVPTASMRNRAAAEIKSSALMIADDFHAGRIFQTNTIPNRGPPKLRRLPEGSTPANGSPHRWLRLKSRVHHLVR